MKKMNEQKKQYASIDITKFFFAICILFLHTGAYHDMPGGWYIQHSILRLAVPFFFVTSGFFWGCKVWEADGISLWQKFLRYEKRLLYPYIVFTGINSLLAAIDMYSKGESIKWMLYHLAYAIIFYPYGALWYVWACMVGMFILYLFLKHSSVRWAMAVGLICYIIALLCNSYYFMLEGTPLNGIANTYLTVAKTPRNGIFEGFPLLLLGVMLAKYRERLIGEKKIMYGVVILFVCVIILNCEINLIEMRATEHETELFAAQPALVAALLILLLNCTWEGPDNIGMVRKMSIGMYFIHRPVLTCLRFFLAHIGVEVSQMTQFFMLLLLCLGICIPVYYYKKEPFYSIMK